MTRLDYARRAARQAATLLREAAHLEPGDAASRAELACAVRECGHLEAAVASAQAAQAAHRARVRAATRATARRVRP